LVGLGPAPPQMMGGGGMMHPRESVATLCSQVGYGSWRGGAAASSSLDDNHSPSPPWGMEGPTMEQRKTIPAWIREGLEKTEREKAKQLEKEA
ncbi:hypothetical protein PMAYCL1PPCAC_25509, partial [Pristionchus mayeri]